MRKCVPVVAFLIFAACSDGAVEDAVRDRLVDPESARFGEISYSDGGDYACAEVNAKNRMGGYTGDTQMVVAKMDGEWVSISDLEQTHADCIELINKMEKDKEATS